MTGSRSTARPGTPNPISPVPAARNPHVSGISPGLYDQQESGQLAGPGLFAAAGNSAAFTLPALPLRR